MSFSDLEQIAGIWMFLYFVGYFSGYSILILRRFFEIM